jgi:hypothetical protein
MSSSAVDQCTLIRQALGGSDLTVCVFKIIGAVRYVDQYVSFVDQWGFQLAAEDQDLSYIWDAYDACVRFATLPRLRSQLHNMVHLECACPEPHGEMHRLGVISYTDKGEGMPPFTYLLNVLMTPYTTYAVAHTPAAQIRATKCQFPRDRWPRSADALAPHGIKNTTFAILELFHLGLDTHTHAAAAVESLITWCHPTAIPLLVTYAPFVKLGITEVITQAKAAVLSSSHHETALSSMTKAVDLLHEIFVTRFSEENRRVFTDRFMPDIISALNDAAVVGNRLASVATQSHAGLDQMKSQIGGIIQSCAWDCSVKFSSTPIPPTIKQHLPSPSWERARPLLRGYAALRHLVFRMRCTAQGCTRTIFDAPLHRCAGCRRVMYCSRQCQRRAWTQLAPNHRDLCSSIRFVCQKYGIRPYFMFLNMSQDISPADVHHFVLIAVHVMYISQNDMSV